jgi:inhibitor of KinA sporulation pathway (predicted exonuclease)
MFDCQRIVVFDMEWTSWPGFRESGWDQPGRYCEVVQIGAVALAAHDGFREVDSFQILVKPNKNPVVSDYFRALTGITPAMVKDEGVGFPDALSIFMDFAGPEPVQFACFGMDVDVIEMNCGFWHMPMPAEFGNHVDIKKAFLDRNIVEDHWESSDLPRYLGLPQVGEAHTALADSRALAAALRHVFNGPPAGP